MLKERIETEIQRQRYAILPFALSQSELDEAATSFGRFLELPAETKQAFTAKAHPEDRGSTIGYVLRTKEEGKDQKEYFHYNRHVPDFFPELLGNNPVIDTFLLNAHRIYTTAEQQIIDITDTFGVKERFIPEQGPPRFYLRFLHYHHHNTDTFSAKGHYDRGALTLALWESAPGLRIGPKDQQVEVTHRNRDALLFPGIDAEHVFGWEGAWHDVVQKTASDRKAIVFFVNRVDQPDYTEEQTHTCVIHPNNQTPADTPPTNGQSSPAYLPTPSHQRTYHENQ